MDIMQSKNGGKWCVFKISDVQISIKSRKLNLFIFRLFLHS